MQVETDSREYVEIYEGTEYEEYTKNFKDLGKRMLKNRTKKYINE